MKHNSTTTHLDLSEKELNTGDCAVEFAKNGLGTGDCTALTKAIKASLTITHLNLSQNGLALDDKTDLLIFTKGANTWCPESLFLYFVRL